MLSFPQLSIPPRSRSCLQPSMLSVANNATLAAHMWNDYPTIGYKVPNDSSSFLT